MSSALRLRRLAFSAAVFTAPAALIAPFFASPAAAAINVSSSITNSYGFVFNANASTINQTIGGDLASFYRGNVVPSQSELGLNYTAYADKGSFFFLHDNYCVGSCATASMTTITFTITNNNDGPEDIRFDSQITPGHLARLGFSGTTLGAFQFTVKQVEDGFEDSTLYQATGQVGPETINLNTGNLPFNGLTRTQGNEYEVYDWGKTNLAVPLRTLNPGETTQLVYQATYLTQQDSSCTDILQCNGVQVVFGDPRNSGAVDNAANLGNVASVADGLLDPLAPRPVIGGLFAPSMITGSFVNPNDPAQAPQDPFTAPTYDMLFQSHVLAVPEPASWAMMIAGFAMLGGAVRRRKLAAAWG